MQGILRVLSVGYVNVGSWKWLELLKRQEIFIGLFIRLFIESTILHCNTLKCVLKNFRCLVLQPVTCLIAYLYILFPNMLYFNISWFSTSFSINSLISTIPWNFQVFYRMNRFSFWFLYYLYVLFCYICKHFV